MRARNVVISGAAVAAMIMGYVSPASAAPADKATGGVKWLTTLGVEASGEFNAQAPGKGKVNVRNHDGVTFHGTVDCYRAVSATESVFSGTIDRSSGANIPNNDQGTAAFIFFVTDAGSPAKSGDQVTLVRSDVPINCNAPHTALQLPAIGNLVVHNS